MELIKQNIINRYCAPAYIVIDGGKQFHYRQHEDLEAKYGPKPIRSATHFAQGNGQAKMSNQTIIEKLKRRVHRSGKKWYVDFDDILWPYRTTRRESTGETPFSMIYGTNLIARTEIRSQYSESPRQNIFLIIKPLKTTKIFLDE